MDAPWVQPSSAGIFQLQAGDLTVTIDDHTPDSGTGLEGQRDIYHGVAARLVGRRGSDVLEPASGLGHGSPPACDPVRIHAHARVEFVACLLPVAPDESLNSDFARFSGSDGMSCVIVLALAPAGWRPGLCARSPSGSPAPAFSQAIAAVPWPPSTPWLRPANGQHGRRPTPYLVQCSIEPSRSACLRHAAGVRRAGLPRQSPALTPGQRRREAPP